MESLLSPTTKHVVWDWNGTLFDDAWLCVEVINELLDSRGLPALTGERYQEIFAFPVTGYYEQLGFNPSRDSFKVLSSEFVNRYQERQHRCGLRPDALETLAQIAARGISQSILSASQDWRLAEQVERCAVRHYFSAVAGIDNHYAGGKLELGVKAIAQLALPPEAVLLIGDTDHDATVARHLGIRCVLIPSGHQSSARLAACGVPVMANLRDITAAHAAVA